MTETNLNQDSNLQPNQAESLASKPKEDLHSESVIEDKKIELSPFTQDAESEEQKREEENKPKENELEQTFVNSLDAQDKVDLELENPQEQEVEKNQTIEDELQDRVKNLRAEITQLEMQKNQLLTQQQEIQKNLTKMVQEGVKELEQKKQNLEISLQKLERRQERTKEEMRTTFAGVSQDLAIRIQGFKDYIVGSLQDLAIAAEQLELPTATFQTYESSPSPPSSSSETNLMPQFAENSFKEETKKIRSLLDQYRIRPDYYGPPWQLRRTFEPIHAERVSNWFFVQGGKGAIPSMGSRLQNILVASSIISVLYHLYGDRFRTLLLSNTPERLGEWRRGLQDCLGISRSDFGPNRGVVLFENPESLSQKAERLIERKDLPLIIMDQTEDRVSLSLLQFPLWLAFASEPQPQSSNYFY
jgi:hypothetical protein